MDDENREVEVPLGPRRPGEVRGADQRDAIEVEHQEGQEEAESGEHQAPVAVDVPPLDRAEVPTG